MKLDLQMLDSATTLNNLIPVNEVEVYPGATATVMFQLINAATGQRYIPAIGAQMNIVLNSTNNNNVLKKIPIQPFIADDRSIWSFAMSAADTSIAAGVNIQLTLTEGANVNIVWAKSVLILLPFTPYQA